RAFIEDQAAKPPARADRLELAGAMLDGLVAAAGDRYATAAEQVYRELAAVRPEKILSLAAALGRSGRCAEALDQCERAWRTSPPEAVAYACMAVLHAGPARPEPVQRRSEERRG